ncbi:Na(+)/H(+) exchange regulatory cofactor NHE-RF1-like isoform X2 [Scleropages formosus]|uniref:Na(+)/H(+) exchange regulatory cofactor NHE-RF n=1 Tax=Scleropages formosus TaxID=113540 RepID=A0A8C9QUN3_SCLFO|nr:Na(+)/H(+) exchange regulatory cofactor NHE-RF1-like isoform X2 [Scleropages formosus]
MSSPPRPRLCVLEKSANGYGFHLHGEKGKSGQYIRLVEPDSPAEASGLRAGDKLVWVCGDNVEGESHQQVVSRIRAVSGRLELVVVDKETDELLKKHNLKCLVEYVTEGVPVPSPAAGADEDDEPRDDDDVDDGGASNGTPRQASPAPEENGELPGPAEKNKKLSVSSEKESRRELRPRLCNIKKGASGYGFNLHSEKSKPGQYIRAVDDDSPAQKSGLRPQDRIVQVNGTSVEGKQHSEVVAAIKAGGDETGLLVVDAETDAFFRKCGVLPAEKHLTGPLPEPVLNGEPEQTANGKVVQEAEVKASVSPAPSSASSSASLPEVRRSTPPPETKAEKEPVEDAGLALTMSLQQAKERAHQKRSNKRAPPMDWSKRNELFSNL